MTSDQQRDFEHQWPTLALRVNRLMRRKKISPWLAEDLTQETGLRLIRMWPKIDQTQPLWPLVATIALNLMRDEMRKDGSHELTCAVPDSPSMENVERRGMARLELRAVGGALSQMGDAHRHVLLSEVADEPAVAPVPSATRMLRMRARRKLQNLLDHASMLGVAMADQMRRLVRETEAVITKVIPANAEHVSAAAISLLAAISLGVAISPDGSAGAAEAQGEPGGGSATTVAEDVSARATAASILDDDIRVRGGRAAREGGASDRRRPRGSISDSRGDRGTAGDDEAPFPGAVDYAARVSDDTYVYGKVQAEVVGGKDAWQRDGGTPEGTGSLNCTVAPSSQGASCSHSGQGWSERGVRADHDGGAVVAGKRVY